MPDPETGWLTKNEVAERLGREVSAVTRLQVKGRLNPVKQKDKTNLYDPDEVAKVLADPEGDDEQGGSRQDQFAKLELGTVRSMLEIVKVPREKIDELFWRIIGHLEADNAKLRAQITSMQNDIDAARDLTAERNLAIKIVGDESAVKRMALERGINMAAALFGGAKGVEVELSHEQLVEILTLDRDHPEKPFLNAEQTKAAQRKVIAYKLEQEKKLKEAEKNKTADKPADPPAVTVETPAAEVKQS